jgi:hypothetical protein
VRCRRQLYAAHNIADNHDDDDSDTDDSDNDDESIELDFELKWQRVNLTWP